MTKPEYSLTSKEVEQILAHAGAFGQGTGAYGQGMETRNLAILDLLVALGLRCSEVVALTPASIIETGNSSVLRVVGKGKHTRDLPLSPALSIQLRSLMALNRRKHSESAARGALFLSRSGRPLDRSTVFRIVQAAAKAANIKSPDPAHEWPWPHLFRHTLARRLLREGTQPRVVQRILGHSKIETTIGTYGVPSIEEVAEALDRSRDNGRE